MSEPQQTVPVPVRPFYKDPLFVLLFLGVLFYLTAENLQGKPLTRENVIAAVIAAVLALGRLLAPYVKSSIPWFDRALQPPDVGTGGGPRS